MPDIAGNWDRRGDSPYYVRTSGNGVPIFERYGKKAVGWDALATLEKEHYEKRLARAGIDFQELKSKGYDINSDGSVISLADPEKPIIGKIRIKGKTATLSLEDFDPKIHSLQLEIKRNKRLQTKQRKLSQLIQSS
jgi:hypothetical protein